MKKIRIFLIVGICLLGVTVLLCIFTHPHEPLYKGQPVTYWMLKLHSDQLSDSEGLSAMGTNALPYIIKALDTKESLYSRCLRRADSRKRAAHSFVGGLWQE